MSKEEMIKEIVSLCNANKNNSHCSIYWLADMIKEVVEGNSYLGDLEEVKEWKLIKYIQNGLAILK